MTSIDELKWMPHPAGVGGERAVVKFENGYEASVLRGGPFYTSGDTFEIAVKRDGRIVYDTPITEDVLGHLTKAEADQALRDIAALPLPAGEPT